MYRPVALEMVSRLNLSPTQFHMAFGIPESVAAWSDVLDYMALAGIFQRRTPRPLTMDRVLPRRPRDYASYISPSFVTNKRGDALSRAREPGYGTCTHCGAFRVVCEDRDQEEHASDCPYRMAQEWVEANQ